MDLTIPIRTTSCISGACVYLSHLVLMLFCRVLYYVCALKENVQKTDVNLNLCYSDNKKPITSRDVDSFSRNAS